MNVGILSYTLQMIGASKVLQELDKVRTGSSAILSTGQKTSSMLQQVQQHYAKQLAARKLNLQFMQKEFEIDKKTLQAAQQYKRLQQELRGATGARRTFLEAQTRSMRDASFGGKEPDRAAISGGIKTTRGMMQQAGTQVAGMEKWVGVLEKVTSVLTRFAAVIGAVVVGLATLGKWMWSARKQSIMTAEALGRFSLSAGDIRAASDHIRKSVGIVNRTFEEGVPVYRSYIAYLKGTGVTYEALLQTSDKVARQSGQDIGKVSETIAKAARGSKSAFDELAEMTGYSYERITGILGRPLSRDPAKAFNELFNIIESGTAGAEAVTQDAVVDMQKWWKQLAQSGTTAMSGMTDAMLQTAEDGATPLAKSIQEITAASDNLKFSVSVLDEWESALTKIADRWADVQDAIMDSVEAIKDMDISIRAAMFSGTRFEAQAYNISKAFERGLKHAGGGAAASPERAFKNFKDATTGITGMMGELKDTQERLTGYRAIGGGQMVYTGQRATGREAYILQATRAAQQKAAGEGIVGMGASMREDATRRKLAPDDPMFQTAKRLEELGAQIEGTGDPKVLQDALAEAAHITAAEMEKAAKAQQDLLQKQADAITKEIPNILQGTYAAIQQSNLYLQKLSGLSTPEIERMRSEATAIQTAMTQRMTGSSVETTQRQLEANRTSRALGAATSIVNRTDQQVAGKKESTTADAEKESSAADNANAILQDIAASARQIVTNTGGGGRAKDYTPAVATVQDW